MLEGRCLVWFPIDEKKHNKTNKNTNQFYIMCFDQVWSQNGFFFLFSFYSWIRDSVETSCCGALWDMQIDVDSP